MVVDKPAGLLTAPTPESDRSNLLVAAQPAGAGRRGRCSVVHRLDLPTSGLLVFAKTDPALTRCPSASAQHDLERVYLAVVAGLSPPGSASSISRSSGARPATRVAVLERFGARATLLRCTLETGRTHQIRLHCRALGHPCWAIRPTASATRHRSAAPGPARHPAGAAHPRTAAPLAWDSPWPADLTPWLAALRGPTEPGSRSGG